MWPKLTELFSHGFMVFDNEGDATGDDTTKAGNGGGDTTQTDDNKTDQQKGQTFDLNVGGENRTVTLDEMKELATKSAGADAKFQSAADMKKAAESGIRIGNLVKSLNKEYSEADAKELAVLLDIDPGEFMEYLNTDDGDNKTGQQRTGQDKTGTDGITKEQFSKAFTDMFGFSPAEAKSRLDFSQQRHIESARQEIRKISDESVDKDEIFGKMIVGENKDNRLAVIKDMVAEDVLRKIQDGVPFGADMVDASVQKIRAHLTKFGIPNKPDQHPIVLGLGPSGGLPAEVQADEPIKRVNSAEDKDGSNFVARWMQKGLKALKENQTRR